MLNPQFIKPKYNERCFADIPATVKYLLGKTDSPPPLTAFPAEFLRRYDTVILLFVDAFGWSFFDRHRTEYPFLRRFAENAPGAALKLTAQFPSTTAAHVTAIHTGLPPAQSGVFEWQYYEPKLDAIIAPLLFSFYGTKERDTLLPTGIDPRTILPAQTIYFDLNEMGVESHIFQYRAYTPSTYSDVVFRGAKTHPYGTFSESLVNMRTLIEHATAPSYFFMYFPQIDSVCHEYGPDSPQVAAEIDTFFIALERLFAAPLDGKLKNTLLMVTADHGQMAVNPETTVYLNRDPRFAGIERFIRRNGGNELLVPAGSPRDMFLYIKEEMLDEAREFLQKGLSGAADVAKTADLIAAGYFGAMPPSRTFMARVGNLVILPYENQTVWWYEKDRFEMKFRGHHGGLSPQEMEIPLLLYRF